MSKFMQIEPQPARGTLREEMWEDPNYIAEEKYDGDRRIAQFCGRVVRFTGRRISKKDGLFVEKTENVPHLSAAYAVVGKGIENYPEIVKTRQPPASLDGTVLDGEMIADYGRTQDDDGNLEAKGGLSKYVTSIMGSFPEEAVRKQIERGWLRYVVFDCLFYKGEDIRGKDLFRRWAFANAALKEWGNPFVSISKQYGEVRPSDKRKAYEKIVAGGGEGVILKHLNHRYGDKTGWVKVKKQATADVVIMGFVPAKEMSVKKGEDKPTMTKYAAAGLIGAVRVGQYVPRLHGGPAELMEVATVSGIDDLLREEMTKHPKKFIGRVVEIKHNGREPTGRFRHPRFNRSRPDKQAKDCVYREDET